MSADGLHAKATLVGPASSKEDPINHGHGAQFFPPASRGNISNRGTQVPNTHRSDVTVTGFARPVGALN